MITFVNVFTVLPENQQDAFHAIKKIYTDVVSKQPGFIGAKLIVSDDGVRVTAITNWETKEDLKALRYTQGFRDLHDANFYKLIVSSDNHIYSTIVEILPKLSI